MPLPEGTRLGPYEVLGLLGAGGMGEVYRARDPRLARDVAIKVLANGVVDDLDRLRRFEREARAVASLNHPGIVSVYDVGSADGVAYVVMELLGGETLQRYELRHTPGERQVLDIAAQTARALDAAHRNGVVHRDLKPANLFVTYDGRVKILDFGLARLLEPQPRSGESVTESSPTHPGAVLGTVAYMSPEQARGVPVDPRSDIFSLGVIVSELACGKHPFVRETSVATLAAILEEPPAGLAPGSPGISPALRAVLNRCLEKNREERFRSAHDLAIALESLSPPLGTSRALPEMGESSPYPGLQAFTARDAAVFFGRESEVASLCSKMQAGRLLALIGPSGAGKSSFVRAGVVPTRPQGWGALVCTPGGSPFKQLGQTLAPELSRDPEALRMLVEAADPEIALQLVRRWRDAHAEALVVVDQFEELFTLSPPAVQASFATLLGRACSEAGACVLLSLRDDFLIRCCEQPSLAPVLGQLTALLPLSGGELRRALVEPALARGYRFSDEMLADEMLASVEGVRSPLPLLAFAMSQLWDRRDREAKLLTRNAYDEIGGVVGALARHAEETLTRIEMHAEGVAREMFIRLVTAHGTRAVVGREELLSAFEDRARAESVLETLTAARLVTSYQGEGASGDGEQQIEIVHEALLTAWPRLARWRAQEADGAQLRDQLRQAAQLWHERGRPPDLLWAGQAFRDFAAWRERRRVPLTAVEDAFAKAMELGVTRRRRRRRAALVALIGMAATVATVTTAMWQRSEASRRRAESEVRRAEAGKLLALAERELGRYPTGALALVLRSLELTDTEPGRLLALRILQQGPVARIAVPSLGDAEGGVALGVDFSSTGEWVAIGGYQTVELLHRDGARRLTLGDYASAGQEGIRVRFSPNGDLLATNLRGDVRVYELPIGREIRRQQVEDGVSSLGILDEGFLTMTRVDGRTVVRSWPWRSGPSRLVGVLARGEAAVATAGSVVVQTRAQSAFVRSVRDASEDGGWAPRLVARHRSALVDGALTRDAQRVALSDTSGAIALWATDSQRLAAARLWHAPGTSGVRFDPTGRWLSARGTLDGRPAVRLFDLVAPAASEPLLLRRNAPYMNQVAFGSRGDWLATTHATDISIWWLGGEWPRVLTGHEAGIEGIAFTPDGRELLSASADGTVRAWPLRLEEAARSRVVFRGNLSTPELAVDPSGQTAAVVGPRGRLNLIRRDGLGSRALAGFGEKTELWAIAFGDEGRVVASTPYIGPTSEKVVRVWNLETGVSQVLGPLPGAGEGFLGGVRSTGGLAFQGSDRLLACSYGAGLVSLDRDRGTAALVADRPNLHCLFSSDRRFVVGWHTDAPLSVPNWEMDIRMSRYDLEGGGVQPLQTHPRSFGVAALDPSDTLLASGGVDGSIWIQPVSGGEPHLLLGHEGAVLELAFSPDGKWLASSGEDRTIRLWPVPDVSTTPFHRREHGNVLAILRSHTNLRAVPSVQSDGGYELKPDPFPGWAVPPQW